MSRVGRGGNFFAIMGPGFYIFSIIAMTISAATARSPDDSVWLRIVAWNTPAHVWILGTVTIFFSFLFGSMLRIFPINDTDNLAFNWSVRRRFPSFFSEPFYEESFPFPEFLKKCFKQVRTYTSVPIDRLNLFKSEDEETESYLERLLNTFNFWKMTLCEANEPAFTFIQEFESRVRLFAGMVRAGVVGSFISGVAILWLILTKVWLQLATNLDEDGHFYSALSILFVFLFSIPIAFVARGQLRLARIHKKNRIFWPEILRRLVFGYVILSLLVFCIFRFKDGVNINWLIPFLLTLLFSAAMFFLAGDQLRRVRMGEVKHTLIAYLSLYQANPVPSSSSK